MGDRKIKSTKAMERGLRLEEEVIKIVEKSKKMTINRTGMHLVPYWPIFGASPDGINENFVMEIKCPSKPQRIKEYETSTSCYSPLMLLCTFADILIKMEIQRQNSWSRCSCKCV